MDFRLQYLLRLFQFARGHTGLLYFVNNSKRQLLRGFAFLRFERGINAKKTWIPRRVGKRRDAKREPSLFAQASVKTRAAAVA